MPKTPPFAVLFDMDGVLVDTEPSHRVAHEIMRKRLGFTAEEVDKAFNHGGTLKQFYKNMQQMHAFEVTFDEFADELLEEVFTHLRSKTEGTDPKLLKLLDRLRAHDIPMAIGTSALRRSSVGKLTIAKLHEEFDIIVTSEDVTHPKPDPEIYLTAARKLGVAPDRCIVVEDSPTGIKAGKAAGMTVIGYSKYVADPSKLREADLVINDYDTLTHEQLLKLVAGKA